MENTWENNEKKSLLVFLNLLIYSSFTAILALYKGMTRLPSWSSCYESACQCRGHELDPWSGKIPHATGQLGPSTATTEAHVPRARTLQQEKTLQ